MASGCAIVAVDTIFNREVLRDSGVFVRPSASEITKSVAALLDHPEELLSMKYKAFSQAKERFSWDAVNNEYIDLLAATWKSKPKSLK